MAALAALAVSCGGGADDAGQEPDLPGVVERATVGDAVLTLHSDGPLPNGVESEDIRIVAVDAEALVAERPAGVEHVASFTLEPDGAQFDPPLRLTIESPGGPDRQVFGAHTGSGGSVELLQADLRGFDTANGTATHQLELTHFSEVDLWNHPDDGTRVDLLPPEPGDTYLVGESFTVRVQVTIEPYDWDVLARTVDGETNPAYRVSSIEDRAWSARYRWTTSGGSPPVTFDFGTVTGAWYWEDEDPLPSPLSPERVPTPEPGEPAHASADVAAGSDILRLEQEFTCTEVGRYYVFFWTMVERAVVEQTILGPDDVRRRERTGGNPGRVGVTGQCVAPSETTVADATLDPGEVRRRVATTLEGAGPERDLLELAWRTIGLYDDPGTEPRTEVIATFALPGDEGTERPLLSDDPVGAFFDIPSKREFQNYRDAPGGSTRSSFSESEVPPKEPDRPETRLEATGARRFDLPDLARQTLLANTIFPCDGGAVATTFCPEPLGSAPGGPHVVAFAVFDGAIPVEGTEGFYQYGFVFDANGDSADNYRAAPQFPNDFFDDTDRWYVLSHDPASGWTFRVSDARGGEITAVASAARVVVLGNTIMLVVPGSEFAVEDPAYRVTAFWHTGDFGRNPPHEWSGDVEPSVGEPLQPLSPELVPSAW